MYNSKKLEYKGEKFDSRKELDFYKRFIEPLESDNFKAFLHPHYDILDSYMLGGLKGRKMVYTPDVVIKNSKGDVIHVFDVKNSIQPNKKGKEYTPSVYMSEGAKDRIRLFQSRYGLPVEIVVPMRKIVRMTVYGTTKSIGLHEFEKVDYDIKDYIGATESTTKSTCSGNARIVD